MGLLMVEEQKPAGTCPSPYFTAHPSSSSLFPGLFLLFLFRFFFRAGVSPVFPFLVLRWGSGDLNEGSGSRESWATGHF